MRNIPTKKSKPFAFALFWLLLSCAGCQTTQGKRSIRVQYLRIQQPPRLPTFCPATQGKRTTQRLLLLFASQWCTHCHAMMAQLQRHPALLKRLQLTPVLMWTDVKNCLKANMAGAHYPKWPFGRPTAYEQQTWAVTATPVIYLVQRGQPLLRIDGATNIKHLEETINNALQR